MVVNGDPEPDLLALFQVSAPRFVDRTGIATIWKVRRGNGQPAALKVYHGRDMRNEAAGFDLLEAWNGRSAARLFGRSGNAALIEWLDGDALGDLTRAGRDDEANVHLVDVANRLHAVPVPAPAGLPRLADWFSGLFGLQVSDTCRARTQRDIARAQKLARNLLAAERDIVALHGDLHHDNIRLGERGYCAFDAKGVLGERAYELANAFRNPKGAEDLVRDPSRIAAMAALWSDKFNVGQQRLLAWAAAKCALSIAWRCNGTLEHDPEFDLLALLVDAAGDFDDT